MAEVIPRVDSTLLESYKNRAVRMIGKAQVVNPHDSSVAFDSNGSTKLLLPPNIQMEEGQYYEVSAKVSDDLTVRVLDSIAMGDLISKCGD